MPSTSLEHRLCDSARGIELAKAQVVVVGNEKGGAGKSTVAIHLAIALLYEGAAVSVLDLDVRQRSTERFFLNRDAWSQAQADDVDLPSLLDHNCVDTPSALAAGLAGSPGFPILHPPGARTP